MFGCDLSWERMQQWLKLSPVALLALLSAMNLLIYMDRGVFLPPVQPSPIKHLKF